MDKIKSSVVPDPKFKLGQRVVPILNPNVELMIIEILVRQNGTGYSYSCRAVDLSIMLFNEFELEALEE